MTKEEMYKLINKEIDVAQKALDSILTLTFKAGFNEGIDKAYQVASETTEYAEEILKLKKV